MLLEESIRLYYKLEFEISHIYIYHLFNYAYFNFINIIPYFCGKITSIIVLRFIMIEEYRWKLALIKLGNL